VSETRSPVFPPDRLAPLDDWLNERYGFCQRWDGPVYRRLVVRPDGIYEQSRDVTKEPVEEQRLGPLPEAATVVTLALPFQHVSVMGPAPKIQEIQELYAAVQAADQALWDALVTAGLVETMGAGNEDA
jgi:hypothetical protein